MCGIWAIFGSDESVSAQCANCLKIAHRGPDCFRIENIPQFNNCAFGFHRLAIMDSLYGMQPFRVHSFFHLWLCYNGEIYNHKLTGKQFEFDYETSMDGESILHLYNKGGVEFASQNMDGVFAVCLLDTEKKEVHLLRDTYGVKPLFTMLSKDGTLAVCSEAKGLQDIVLRNGIEAKIEPFPPGHFTTYNLLPSGKVELKECKAFHTIGNMPLYKTLVTHIAGINENEIYANICTLLRAAVKKRFMSERRIGCMLSGGLDSSLISALVVELAKEEGLDYKIQTFSIGMEGSPDIMAARKVAKHIGSDHHEVIFTAAEGIQVLDQVIHHLEIYDTITIRSSVGMYLMSKYISEKTDDIVIFSGEGSDEVTHGYIYFHEAPSPEDAAKESLFLCDNLHIFDVLRADRMSAAHGLELRVPFLDHQFSGYYLNLPASLKQPQHGIEKYTLRKSFDGSGLLPDDILWRQKEGFSDGVLSQKECWFDILQEFIESEVSDEQLSAAPEMFPFNSPKTKEAYYYRQVFEKHFPGRAKWMPFYWMPKWTNATDPSARTLKHYKTE